MKGPLFSLTSLVGVVACLLAVVSYQPQVTALSPEVKWMASTSGLILSSPYIDGAEDRLFVGGFDNYIYSFSLSSGAIIWQYNIGSHVTSSPTLYNGVVYVGAYDNSIYALNADSGILEWKFECTDMVSSSPLVVNDVLYVGSYDDYLYALDLINGHQVKWQYKAGAEVASSPVINGDLVYVGSNDDYVYAINVASGTVAWRFNTVNGNVHAAPYYADGYLVVSSLNKKVYCLDATSGSMVWEFNTGSKVYAAPIIYKGVVYVGSNDHNMYAIDVATGAQKWKFTATGGIKAQALAEGSLLYFGDSKGNVYGCDVSTGEQQFSYKTGGAVGARPGYFDGTLYICSYDSHVYALSGIADETSALLCPAEGNWPETENGSVATAELCGAGYQGQASRQCVDGTWGQIDTSGCEQMYCMEIVDELDLRWPKTAAGANVTLTCPLGAESGTLNRVCSLDGAWEEASGECHTTNCPQDGDWPETALHAEVELPCLEGSSFSKTRTCEQPETWGSVNTTVCDSLKCEADGEFTETEPGTVTTAFCPAGYDGLITRSCNADGVWDTVDNSTCTVIYCSPVDEWPRTRAGFGAEIACPNGQTGLQTRQCDIQGVWEDISTVECGSRVCPPAGEWPETPVGSTAHVSDCGDGFEGFKSRLCQVGGTWSDTIDDQCVEVVPETVYCQTDGVWNSTATGTSETQPCPEGYEGVLTRACTDNGSGAGVWGDVDDSRCQRVTCVESGHWPETNEFETAQNPCPDGYYGSRTRECLEGGHWSDFINSTCTEIIVYCEAEGDWASTATGHSASKACGDGFEGTITRVCADNGEGVGVWSLEDSSGCTEIVVYCEAEGDWASTATGHSASKACGDGFEGTITRVCADGEGVGVWSLEDSSGCTEIKNATCPPSQGWVSTEEGYGAWKACEGGFHGDGYYRLCLDGGVWAESWESHCEADLVCPPSSGWAGLKAGETEKTPCPDGYTGFRSRTCLEDGTWGEIDSSECVEIITHCEASDGFAQTNVGTIAVKACPDGYTGELTRGCHNDGTWDEIVDHCTEVTDPTCDGEGSWPTTLVGETATITDCGENWHGHVKRECTSDGWSDIIINMCQEDSFCEADDIFPKTYAGDLGLGDCPVGFLGNLERECDVHGEWAVVTIDGCYNPSPGCEASGLWPSTPPGEVAEIACPSGFSGVQRRECDVRSEWMSVSTANCTESTSGGEGAIYCSVDGDWPTTESGTSITLDCESETQSGNRVRRCGANGSWSAVVSSCVESTARTCAAEGDAPLWPETEINNWVKFGCGSGQTGTVARFCQMNGEWSEVENTCVTATGDSTCAADGDWPATPVGETATAECPPGYEGARSRMCLTGASWAHPESTCQASESCTWC